MPTPRSRPQRGHAFESCARSSVHQRFAPALGCLISRPIPPLLIRRLRRGPGGGNCPFGKPRLVLWSNGLGTLCSPRFFGLQFDGRNGLAAQRARPPLPAGSTSANSRLEHRLRERIRASSCAIDRWNSYTLARTILPDLRSGHSRHLEIEDQAIRQRSEKLPTRARHVTTAEPRVRKAIPIHDPDPAPSTR